MHDTNVCLQRGDLESNQSGEAENKIRENTESSGMKENFDSADLLTSSHGFIRRQILRRQQTQDPALVIQHFLNVLHFRARVLRRAVEVPHFHL